MNLDNPIKTYSLVAKFDPYKNFSGTAIIREYEEGKTLSCFNSLTLFVDNEGNLKRFIENENQIFNSKIIDQCKEFMLQYSDYYNILEGSNTKEKIMNLPLFSEETNETITKDKLLLRKFTLEDFKTCEVSYNGESSWKFDLIDIENKDNQIILKGKLLEKYYVSTLMRYDLTNPIYKQVYDALANSVFYGNFNAVIILNKEIFIEELLANLQDVSWVNCEKMAFDKIVITQHTDDGYYYIDDINVNPVILIRNKLKGIDLTEDQIEAIIADFDVYFESDKDLIDNYRDFEWYNLLQNGCCGAEALVVPSNKLLKELCIIKNNE